MARRAKIPVYLEVGTKRVFAGAIDWPGWTRGGRDETAALEALVAYGPRYRRAVGTAGANLPIPASPDDLEIVERLPGNATTDFGAPGIASAADARPLSDADLEHQIGLLRAAWRALDRAARQATGTALAKGPRGGGRDREAILRHVLEAQDGYLRALGARSALRDRGDHAAAVLHRAVVAALRAAPRVGPPPPGPRGGARWTARYFVRRSAWHALDHAWEIEDRSAR